jgi:hypothetical protein
LTHFEPQVKDNTINESTQDFAVAKSAQVPIDFEIGSTQQKGTVQPMNLRGGDGELAPSSFVAATLQTRCPTGIQFTRQQHCLRVVGWRGVMHVRGGGNVLSTMGEARIKGERNKQLCKKAAMGDEAAVRQLVKEGADPGYKVRDPWTTTEAW